MPSTDIRPWTVLFPFGHLSNFPSLLLLVLCSPTLRLASQTLPYVPHACGTSSFLPGPSALFSGGRAERSAGAAPLRQIEHRSRE